MGRLNRIQGYADRVSKHWFAVLLGLVASVLTVVVFVQGALPWTSQSESDEAVTADPEGASVPFDDESDFSPIGGLVEEPWEGVVPENSEYLGDRLQSGQSLGLGDYIASENLLSALFMTRDGNVVLAADGNILWETNTGGLGATGFKIQRDGNVVVLNDAGVLWSPESLPPDEGRAAPDAYEAATETTQLVIEDSGNLVAYLSSDTFERESWWETGTGVIVDLPSLVLTSGCIDEAELCAGDEMRTGEYIHNHNKSDEGPNAPHAMVLTEDGNLVIYGAGGNVVWESGTDAQGIDRLIVQEDGDVVLVSAGGATRLHTGTAGDPGAYLRLNNEGLLVVHKGRGDARSALWDGRKPLTAP